MAVHQDNGKSRFTPQNLTYNPVSREHLTPQNNCMEKNEQHRIHEYETGNNNIRVEAYNIAPNSVHMFKRMNQAFIEQHDAHKAIRYGGTPEYNPGCHQLIERWKDQYARRGQSTFCKSSDDILGG